MYQFLIKTTPVFLTFAIVAGVLLHDTQLDQATKVALTVPIMLVSYGGAEIALKMSDPHVHNDRAGSGRALRVVHNIQPRVQTRGDDKKYVVQAKSNVNSYGNDYYWPSI